MKDKRHFTGLDADLEASLFEYGFICTPHTEDFPDEHFVVYRAGIFEGGEFYFECGFKQENELNSLINGEDWADKEDIGSFLSFTGLTKKEWLALPFVQKFGGCFQYWGPENIMGTTYSPLTEKEVRSEYL